jgi:hypothetical protein
MASSPSVVRNPISLVGAWLTTIGAFAFIVYYVIESFGLVESPYSGLIGFIALPALFLFGLFLIPVGMWREARRRRRGQTPWAWPAIDLGRSRTRGVALAVVLLTLVNLSLVTVATVGSVHYMEENQFCGQVCHTPMKPQFTAHQATSHASVKCVQCHVGPGAAGTVRAKLNGARQAYEFLTNTYHRPIPTPARNIPAPAETCVRCHALNLPARDVTYTQFAYADDEANTETATPIVMFTQAAHWHARPDVIVEFAATDATRETIPYVRVTEPGGVVTEYQSTSETTRPSGPLRRMDCADCHNRPAHTMAASAEQAVDLALAQGRISKALPFAKREAVAVLTTAYADEGLALAAIRQTMTAFYQARPSVSAADVERTIAGVSYLYRTNVFPDMKVTWGTYRSQLAHPEGAGCFRCHDDEHKAPSGKAVRQDCALCHKVE